MNGRFRICWHGSICGLSGLLCLRERPEDIAPNLEYELERFTERTGTRLV
ncbi:MAG: hypothetical protein R2941_01945 [Desulfobacterales bacterium]